jgi:glycosyltransferase involved in cell wall biosynthesis
LSTVLSVAYPFAPVGPGLVGGAEQILSDLDQALVAAGHRSLVIACEGSETAGALFATQLPESKTLDEADERWCRKQLHAALDRALASQHVDLVHVHGMDLYGYEFPPETPLLVTLHLPTGWYSREMLETYKDTARFCYVSESQRQEGTSVFGDAPVIENGVDIEPLNSEHRRADFAMVMGRICPEKNMHSALEAGTRARTQVILAGRVYPFRSHTQYFEQKVEPQLEAGRSTVDHKFVGQLTPAERHHMLAEAKCLLHPTLAPETSSLVAMEALAAGTPVIAYRSGALPEIVEHGVTGFLVDDVERMAEAIGKIHCISRAKCHDAARRRFPKQRMIDRYFDLYRTILMEGSTRSASSGR